MRNFRIYLVLVFCVGILVALTGSVVAEEEFKVKGVTITVIDYFKNSKYLVKENKFKSIPAFKNMPSCWDVMDEDSRNKLINATNSSALEVSNAGGLCGLAIKFEVNGTTFVYDGIWLIASREVIDESEWVPIDEAIFLIKETKKDLKTSSCTIAKEHIRDGSCFNTIILIHIKEIQPQNIIDDDSNIVGRYALVSSGMYKDNLSNLLDVSDPDKLGIAAIKTSTGGYIYHLRDDTELKEFDFGQYLIIQNDSYFMIGNTNFRNSFALADFSRYYNEKIFSKFESLSRDTEGFRDKISEHRKKLVKETSSSISWQKRLSFLETNRDALLVSYEEKYGNIREKLNEIEQFYKAENDLFGKLEKDNSPPALLYGAGIRDQLSQLSAKIEVINAGLSQIESIQDSIKQIYYSERGVALNERAIHESQEISQKAINESRDISKIEIMEARENTLLALIVTFLITFSVTNYFVKRQSRTSVEQNKKIEKSQEETNQLLRDILEATKEKKSKKEESLTFEKLIGVGIILAVIKSIIKKSRGRTT